MKEPGCLGNGLRIVQWFRGVLSPPSFRSRVHFSRCYMTPLVEKGLVARTDPDKPMSPRQEYKLAGDAVSTRLYQ